MVSLTVRVTVSFDASYFDVTLTDVDTILTKRSSPVKKIRPVDGILPKICIVENEPNAFSQIGSAFLNAGYVVNPARTGTEAIERIASAVPDVALVKLGLTDISGDIVILKLTPEESEGLRCGASNLFLYSLNMM